MTKANALGMPFAPGVMTPSEIERAMALLHKPNVSLIDVALTVGFSSQSHLNDYFRRIVGVTPARYRAEARPHGRGLSGAKYPDGYSQQNFKED